MRATSSPSDGTHRHSIPPHMLSSTSILWYYYHPSRAQVCRKERFFPSVAPHWEAWSFDLKNGGFRGDRSYSWRPSIEGAKRHVTGVTTSSASRFSCRIRYHIWDVRGPWESGIFMGPQCTLPTVVLGAIYSLHTGPSAGAILGHRLRIDTQSVMGKLLSRWAGHNIQNNYSCLATCPYTWFVINERSRHGPTSVSAWCLHTHNDLKFFKHILNHETSTSESAWVLTTEIKRLRSGCAKKALLINFSLWLLWQCDEESITYLPVTSLHTGLLPPPEGVFDCIVLIVFI